MNDTWATISFCCFVGVLIFALATVMSGPPRRHGIVYATWPEQECRHVEPSRRFDCDNLPDTFDIEWVSEEWRP